MSDFSVITNHPDCQEIISKLLTGSKPKEIAQWLKLKYPKPEQSHLLLTQKILKEFSNSQFTDYYDQFTKDRAAISNNSQVSAALSSNKVYRERIEEVAGKEIDIINLIRNLVTAAYQRMEQVFDVIQENPRSFKGDNYLLRYLSELTSAAEKLEKLRLIGGDQFINHNDAIHAVEQHTALLQETIKDVLAEIDTDTAMLFMNKLHEKLSTLELPKHMTQDERLEKVQMLEAKIVD